MALFLKQRTKARDKLSPVHQIRFLKYLHRLLVNGYSILEALETMSWDKQLHHASKLISQSLKSGESIDFAFEKASFHPNITSLLYFLKENGDLTGNIGKCLYNFEQQIHYQKKLQQVTRYPLLLICIFILLLIAIKKYVLPSFTTIFQTNSSIYWSYLAIDLFINFFFGFIFLITTFIFVWRRLKDKFPIDKQIQLYRKIPIYRMVLQTQTSYFFATHFGSLLLTGMSTKEVINNLIYQRRLPILSYLGLIIKEELSNGVNLDYIISRFPLLNEQLAAIFKNNTDNLTLGKDLTIYAEILMEEVEGTILKMITYIQPIFFSVLATFIIFIYITLLWPMFQLINTI